MSQLIPFEKRLVGVEKVETLNARDLHAFLHVKQRFNDWITKRIEQYGFSEGIDFTPYYESSTGAVRPVEYFITFDMAKQLSMVERNAKGREARQYFIACEKQLREQPMTHGDLLVQMAEAYRRIEAEQAAQKDALITAQAQTIEALSTSQRAEHKADRAVEELQWVSIRQYVYLHALSAQLPPPLQKDYGTWLSGYCVEQNIPTYKAQPNGQQWSVENTYPVGEIKATLMPWLARRTSQITLIRPPAIGEQP